MSQANKTFPPGQAKERYDKLAQSRESFLRRARECAKLTIPTLLPPDGDVSSQKLATPNQSVGAAGVNNLASKILLTLFPPNGRFFRMVVTHFELMEMVGKAAEAQAKVEGKDPQQVFNALLQKIEGETQNKLATYEQAVVQHYESDGNRPTDFEAIKHLITTGNVLRYCAMGKDERPRYYRLDQYVTKRDPDGRILETITREGVSPASLPQYIREACDIPADGDKKLNDVYQLYTRVVRDQDAKCWYEYQELNDKEVPETRCTWPLEKCPWLPLRWSKIDGEDYGRGHVEEYLGDLRSLDALQKAIVDGSVAAARVLLLVSPNGMTAERDIAEAENGDVITGNPNDVACLQMNKFNDFRVAAETTAKLERNIGRAFLLTTAIQRDGERVTAAEFTRLAHELEATLGGNYSTLGIEYQLPLVELTIYSLQRRRKLPKLPKDVKPTILTGVQALGRNNDLERLMTVFDCIQRVPGAAQDAPQRINFNEAYTRIATSQDIQGGGLFRSDEELAQARDAAQKQEMLQKVITGATPPLATALAQAGGAQGSPPSEEPTE